MIRGIVNTSLQFRFLVLIVAGVVMLGGLVQMQNMPVDVLPEFSPPFVEIQTEALGLSAEEVEQMITSPMEQDLLAGVAWLDVIRSESVPGLSSVVVYFEPGTDLFAARQMVAERLSQAAVGLPHVSKSPTMIQPQSSASRFVIIGLSSKDLPLIDLSVLARWVIGPRLLGVPGVANVAIWGMRDRQLQVLVDPERLRAWGVTLEQVVETTGNALWVSSLSFLEASSPGTGGFIDTPNQRLGIWHVLPITSPEDLAQVPLVERETPIQAVVEGAPPLRLGDVAQVVEDHQPLIGDAIINDGPSLLLLVEKLPGTNTLNVTRGVEEAIDALRPGMAGVEFDTSVFRPATFIEAALGNLMRTLIVDALLAVVVLSALLYGWRTALISLLVIPLSLIATVFVLYWLGATLNTMVLAGLVVALGLVIDEAVVQVEHIAKRLRQNQQLNNPQPTVGIILSAAGEMRSTLFFAVFITLLAILPIFVLEGVTSALLRPLATAYAVAVLVSMVVALTVTPALCLILFANASPAQTESPIITWLQRGYTGAVTSLAQRPGLALGLAALFIIIGGLAAWPYLGATVPLLPAFREPYLTVQLESAPSTSRPEMSRIVARLGQELRAIPGVQNVGAHIGRAVLGDQIVSVNSAELWVTVDPNTNYEATTAAVQEAVSGYAGLKQEVKTYTQQTLTQPLTRANDVTTVRVFGSDHTVLQSEAEKVRQAIAGIAGITNLRIDAPVEEPTLEVKVNIAAAQNYGLKPGDVRRAAATLLSGLQVGSLFEEQKIFEVVVWGAPETRDSLTDIRELLIETPSGGHVRLQEVADVDIVPARTVIRREAISPYLDVIFNVTGRDFVTVVSEIKATLRQTPLQLEYHAEVVGNYAAEQAAQQRLWVTALVALAGTLLLLQAPFGSWRLALVVLLTLPMALAGGVLATYLLGNGFSMVELCGLWAVLGLAVRNTLLLVTHFHHLESHEGEAFGLALVVRGARERLGPMLMTALTTGAALLPFILFGNIPGHEVARPLAVVILGGLLTSTIFSLFIMPAVYLQFGAYREPELELIPMTVAGEAAD